MTGLLVVSWLAGAALVAPVRCTTYEEPSLRRWQTVCTDGTRSISTYNRTLQRWETTVTPPAPRRGPR